jgi:serine/threonine-protein kinase
MYALLTGRPPFRAKNLPQMLQLQRFADPEPVRRYANDTPEQLERVVMQLLSKDPAARFPNTQVLARHLQAMVRAFSRPAPDDFALSGEDAGERDAEFLDQSLSSARTQSDPAVSPTGVPAGTRDLTGASLPASGSATHEAATLVAESSAGDAAKSVAAAQPSMPRSRLTGGAAPAARADHFRTVEEDEALAQAERRSWLIVGAQLAALVAVVGGAVAILANAMRPPSADELYKSIATLAEAKEGESLLPVEQPIAEFRRRFPDDPRMESLIELEQRLALEQAERRLQRAQRGGASGRGELLPVERLYLQANAAAAESPARGIAMFESLVALYGAELPATEPEGDVSQPSVRERARMCVQLAENRVFALRRALEIQVDVQLASLRERLATADGIGKSDPTRAAAMYRAIIGLHESDAWATEIVREAKWRLEQLKSVGTDRSTQDHE